MSISTVVCVTITCVLVFFHSYVLTYTGLYYTSRQYSRLHPSKQSVIEFRSSMETTNFPGMCGLYHVRVSSCESDASTVKSNVSTVHLLSTHQYATLFTLTRSPCTFYLSFPSPSHPPKTTNNLYLSFSIYWESLIECDWKWPSLHISGSFSLNIFRNIKSSWSCEKLFIFHLNHGQNFTAV